MSVRENFVRLTLAARDDNVAIARLACATMAGQMGYTLNETEELKVALSEAVTNSIVHGYGGDEQRLIDVTLLAGEDGLTIKVADDGIGIEDIPRAMEPAFSTDAERMGLGFVFMQSFTDSVDVASEAGSGTTVVMKKRLP